MVTKDENNLCACKNGYYDDCTKGWFFYLFNIYKINLILYIFIECDI